MIKIDPVPKIDSQPPFPADQMEIISDRDTANTKQHMTVRTYTQKILWRTWAAMRSLSGPYVNNFRISSGRTLKSNTTYLTALVIELFELLRMSSLASIYTNPPMTRSVCLPLF